MTNFLSTTEFFYCYAVMALEDWSTSAFCEFLLVNNYDTVMSGDYISTPMFFQEIKDLDISIEEVEALQDKLRESNQVTRDNFVYGLRRLIAV